MLQDSSAVAAFIASNSKSGAQLKDYQIDGLSFMINAFKNEHGTILADEMGLGKTCQVCL